MDTRVMRDTSEPDIYDTKFVTDLFSEMSKTYGVVNYISSFGFTKRWRRQCAEQIEVPNGAIVYDLMTGMGEMFPHILSTSKPSKIIGIDLCPEMCRLAKQKTNRFGKLASIEEGDVLSGENPSDSADIVFASFGLKTFSVRQSEMLAREVFRILKPGGQFCFMEISTPRAPIIRWPYLFYLNYLIPLIGKVFMGNPDNYRMLGVYTERFGSCESVAAAFERAGFEVSFKKYFFGCMSSLKGRKPGYVN